MEISHKFEEQKLFTKQMIEILELMAYQLSKISRNMEITPIPKMDTSISTTTMDDLNTDCLAHIVRDWSIEDLLTAAHLNSQWSEAAKYGFAYKYGKKSIRIQDVRVNQKKKVIETKDQLLIRDLKVCLQMLRYFGGSITKLELSNMFVSSHRGHLYQYIAKYCAKSVKEIVFDGDYFNAIEQPFESAEKVRFIDGHLGSNIAQLNQSFPKIQSLEFSGRLQVANQECILVEFPNLKHFGMNVNKFGFRRENIATAIKMNSNIKSLQVKWDGDTEYLQRITSTLESLKCLQINGFSDELDDIESNPVHLKNVKHLQIALNILKIQEIPKIPLTFDALEEFTFYGRVGRHFFDFIKQNRSISKLDLQLISEEYHMLDGEEYAYIAASLPALMEVNMEQFKFTGRQALNFVNKCQLLDKFRFTLQDAYSYYGLVQRLDSKWIASIDDFDCVRLECKYKGSKKYSSGMHV